MTKKKQAPKASKNTKTEQDPHIQDGHIQDRYVQALIARGEAAKAVDGELPEGATHEIVEDEQGRVTVVRRRFFEIG